MTLEPVATIWNVVDPVLPLWLASPPQLALAVAAPTEVLLVNVIELVTSTSAMPGPDAVAVHAGVWAEPL